MGQSRAQATGGLAHQGGLESTHRPQAISPIRRQRPHGRDSPQDHGSARADVQTVQRTAPAPRPHLLRRLPPPLPTRAVRDGVPQLRTHGDRTEENKPAPTPPTMLEQPLAAQRRTSTASARHASGTNSTASSLTSPPFSATFSRWFRRSRSADSSARLGSRFAMSL